MAVVRENLGNGEIRTYSNAGFKVHGGFPEADYDVVYDPEEADRTYTETRIPVDAVPVEPSDVRSLSKRSLMNALKSRNLWTAVKSYMQSTDDLWEQWEASTTLDEDEDLVKDAVTALKASLGLTDEQVEAIMAESEAEQ